MSKSDKIMKRFIATRDKLFPELKEEGAIWHSKTNDGWRNIPRCMVFIMNIIDNQCSGAPPSKVYLALWLRSYESYFIQDLNLQSLALECNHTGQRAVTTLKKKLASLEELGFIKQKNNFNVIALPNPYLVTEKLKQEGRVSEELWTGLILRMAEVGEESF